MEPVTQPDLPQLDGGARLNRIGSHLIVGAPDRSHYLQLDAAREEAVRALDGRRTLEQLEEAYGHDMAELVDELRTGRCLAGAPPQTQRRVLLTGDGFELSGAYRLVDRLYPLARPFFGRLGAAVVVVAVVVGVVVMLGGHLPTPLAQVRPDALTAMAILMVELVLLVVHELAHAFVLTHYGERVGRVGLGVYWGSLCMYVDATAALLLPRRARMLQAGAGLIVDAALVGVAGVIAIAAAPHAAEAALAQIAVSLSLGALVNATPLLQLDGYWVLADALDTPDLHRRGRHAVRRFLHGERDRRTAAQAGFAAVGVALGLLFITGAVVLWLTVMWPLLTSLWGQGTGSRILAVLLALPTLAPLTVDGLSSAVRAGRRIVQCLRAIAGIRRAPAAGRGSRRPASS